jgi:hypothetical protein
MIVELVAGMIFAAFPLAFIAYIVIMLSIFLPPVLITGMVWDIFVLLIILYGGIFVGVMATAMLDNVTGLSGLVGNVLSRIYFALTPLWQALYRIAGPIIKGPAAICARIPVLGDLFDLFKVAPEKEVPEPPASPRLEITAPQEVIEGYSFNVNVTLNGQPMAGAVVYLGDQVVVAKSDGTAQLTAPDVESDKKLTITASSVEAEGSAEILVLMKNTMSIPGFEVIVIAIVLVALLAISLAGSVADMRRRKR